MLIRCFLSPGAGTLTISRELRLVCQVATIFMHEQCSLNMANKKFAFVCPLKSHFHMLRLDKQVAVYSSGSQLEWREVEGGQLPVPRSSPRATLVGETLFLTGGLDDYFTYATSILSWDPVTESWQAAGNLTVPRHWHAAVAVPTSIVQC